MYMLALQALSEDPTLCPHYHVPKDPIMLIAYPTIGLEEEMATLFRKYGLSALALNRNTTSEARTQGRNLWNVAIEEKTSIILLSPEMMNTDGYEYFIHHPEVRPRLRGFGVNEAHLARVWGKNFREAFLDLGFNRERIPDHASLILTTATLPIGNPTNRLLDLFNLNPGSYHLIRRSNLRPDIRLLFRTLQASVNGISFPDLNWVLKKKRKTIVFCRTVKQANNLVTYLRSLSSLSSPIKPDRRIRHYNAINFGDFNIDILEDFRNDPETQIIVATDALMVGIDLPNVQDVIVLLPKTLDEALQKVGRAGRNRSIVIDARGIIYVTNQSLQDAKSIVSGGKRKRLKKAKSEDESMDDGLVRILTADCKVVAQNIFYGNPSSDPPCLCSTCMKDTQPPSDACQCSGCDPEDIPIDPGTLRQSKAANNPVPKKERLSRKMHQWGTKRLVHFRLRLYQAGGNDTDLFPPYAYLPDPLIKLLLDRYPLITSTEALGEYIKGHSLLEPHSDTLFSELHTLQLGFDTIREEQARLKAKRRAAKKLVVESNEEGTSDDDGERSDKGVDLEAKKEDLKSEEVGINIEQTAHSAITESTHRSQDQILVGHPISRSPQRRKQSREMQFIPWTPNMLTNKPRQPAHTIASTSKGELDAIPPGVLRTISPPVSPSKLTNSIKTRPVPRKRRRIESRKENIID
ncbi:hypothetical protein QCA50_009537 [Cerrena zonata]|uniref:DNA 3'-5' helicase n=1 Tax=Cerrena zonata TaxID=2478898 RepID=A0AAW0G3V0_9APHY